MPSDLAHVQLVPDLVTARLVRTAVANALSSQESNLNDAQIELLWRFCADLSMRIPNVEPVLSPDHARVQLAPDMMTARLVQTAVTNALSDRAFSLNDAQVYLLRAFCASLTVHILESGNETSH